MLKEASVLHILAAVSAKVLLLLFVRSTLYMITFIILHTIHRFIIYLIIYAWRHVLCLYILL